MTNDTFENIANGKSKCNKVGVNKEYNLNELQNKELNIVGIIHSYLKEHLKINVVIEDYVSCDATYPNVKVQLLLDDEIIDEKYDIVW